MNALGCSTPKLSSAAAFPGLHTVKRRLSTLAGTIVGRVWQNVIANPSLEAPDQEVENIVDTSGSAISESAPDLSSTVSASSSQPLPKRSRGASLLRIDVVDPARPGQSADADDFDVLMVAMEIADEIGQFTNAQGPVPTDIPLMDVGLNTATAPKLLSWINARFDYHMSVEELLAENADAEVLARKVLSNSCPLSAASCVSIPIIFGSTVQSPSYLIPRDFVEESSVDGVHILSPTSPFSHGVLPNRSNLPQGSRVADKQPIPTTKSDQLSISMAPFESWSGKKTGIVVGLLAMGALMNTPMSPSFNLPSGIPQDVISPFHGGPHPSFPGSMAESSGWTSWNPAPSPIFLSSAPRNRRRSRR